MKALKQTGYGNFSANLQIANTPPPELLANEILVKVYCAALNPHDSKVILGKLQHVEKLDFPAQVGSDFAGRIVAMGEDLVGYAIGDEVMGVSSGALAEYCKTSIGNFCKKPNSISMAEACSFPVVGLTTIQAFDRVGSIKKGNTVLIHAGSGGVGTFAIQYAKTKGAFIYTTTSTKNIALVESLGADVAIDYTRQNYLDICSDIDIVFDTLGGRYTYDAFNIVKTGGAITSILPAEINSDVAKELAMPKLLRMLIAIKPSKIAKLKRKMRVKYAFVFMRPDQRDFTALVKLLDQQKIVPSIERKFELKDIVSAFTHLSKGHARGKIVIDISSD